MEAKLKRSSFVYIFSFNEEITLASADYKQ